MRLLKPLAGIAVGASIMVLGACGTGVGPSRLTTQATGPRTLAQYIVTTRSGLRKTFPSNSIVGIKIGRAQQKLLSVRGPDFEIEMPASEISSVEHVDGNGKQRAMLDVASPDIFATPCTTGADCGGGGGGSGGVCQSSIEFCCPDGTYNSGCYPSGHDTYGTACYSNASCGDSGDGSVSGIGLILFTNENSYCWFNFVTTVPNCYFNVVRPSAGTPRNLFLSLTVSANTFYVVNCKAVTEGGGFIYAIYNDGKTQGFMRKRFPINTVSHVGYPTDFNGVLPPVTASASIFSRFYYTIVPFDLNNNEAGYCNSTG